MSRPLSRPAASMFFGVVRRSWIVVGPTLTVRVGPSVRNTALAGTCSVSPSATASADGANGPRTGCSLGKAYTPRARRRIVPCLASRWRMTSTVSLLPICTKSAGPKTEPRPRPRMAATTLNSMLCVDFFYSSCKDY